MMREPNKNAVDALAFHHYHSSNLLLQGPELSSDL